MCLNVGALCVLEIWLESMVLFFKAAGVPVCPDSVTLLLGEKALAQVYLTRASGLSANNPRMFSGQGRRATLVGGDPS